MKELQYKDYSEWMRSRDFSKEKEYWTGEFSGELPVLNLATDYNRPKVKSFRGNMTETELGSDLSNDITKMSKAYKCTDYMVFLSAVMILVSSYANQNDVIIGSPVSARLNKETENMLGMFSNTVALRGEPEADKKYSAFLAEIKDKCLKAFENQEYPFDELVNSLNLERDPSRNPLFDVMFLFQEEDETVNFGGFDLMEVETETRIAKFDLTFIIKKKTDHYVVQVEYATDLFKDSTADTIRNHFVQILNEIVNDNDITIGKIAIITNEEKNIIENVFNKTECEFTDKTLIELFEEQAEKNPDNIALIFNNETMTYSQLNAEANCVAHMLLENNIGKNDLVPIIAYRSINMMVGIYGILKAGAAYVPISPDFPEDRVNYILKDCSPKAVVTYKYNIDADYRIIDLNNIEESNDYKRNILCKRDPDSIIYCIYTSGTTGNPKGVMNTNKGLTNRVLWMQKNYPLCENDVILQKTPYTFDVSFWELLWWGVVGAKLSILPHGAEKDPSVICDVVEKTKVTALHFVPSMFSMFISYIENYDTNFFANIKYIFSSGEALNANTVNSAYKMILERKADTEIINVYGPTEASIDVTYYNCKKEVNENTYKIPIGKPISNIKIFIIKNNNLCGIGVPGEICINGVGLAKGYLNRESLTKEKFTPNPFGKGLLYHTGDYGRWLDDGNIEYLGRIDDQVKIRGCRIELGEIESKIKQNQCVKDCAVVIKTDNNSEKSICAYVVFEEEEKIEYLRDELLKEMPKYMIPDYIFAIKSIPTTINGKLDKSKLENPKKRCVKKDNQVLNDVEKKISEIWCEVLKLDEVSIDEEFFTVGGTSINIIKVLMKINKCYPKTVKIPDLFANTTIRSISSFIINNINKNK